jgi:hypothetical protein
MNNPQHPKRKWTLTPDLPPTHCRAIVDDEDDEAEERSGLSGNEAFEEEEEEEHGLIGCCTILISGLKPMEYAAALTRLQGVGLPIVADEAPYCMVMEVMGLDIPELEIEEMVCKLLSCWWGLGCIMIDVFQPVREWVKVAIWVANKGDFVVVTLEALVEFLT